MKLLNIVLVKAYDWEGIYILGKLWDEGHTVDWEDLLSKHVVHISATYDVDEEWLAEVGSFPESLSEVKFNAG